MCGILFSTRSDVSDHSFEVALADLKSRGPHDQSFIKPWPGARLGHTRLAIIDPSSLSNQPLVSQSSRSVLSFNGEIYNYAEVAQALGIQLRRHSDSHLLVEMLEKFGPEALPRLNGMFAFVFIDIRQRSIIFGRDRLGVKPLYYHKDAHGVTVSSEMSALVLLTGSKKTNSFAVRQYRDMRGFFNGNTVFSDVQMFPPGTYEKDGKRSPYWNLSYSDKPAPSDDEIEALVADAVNVRLLADVPVGSLLSGGVDSALVAAISKVPTTWTAGGPGSNEFLEAAANARYLATRHNNHAVDAQEFRSRHRAMVKKRSEPLAVPNEVLLDSLAETISREVRVVLSGEGADELFGGYDRVFNWASQAKRFDLSEFAAIYCYSESPDLEVIEETLRPYLGFQDPYLIVSAFFQLGHLSGLLRRLDFSSMNHGVEVRVPFTDYRLVERLFGLPHEWKSAGEVSKAPLRRVARRYLPEETASAEKIGFPVDLIKILNLEKTASHKHAYEAWFDFNLGLMGVEEGKEI